jgi:LPS O-antigen subunit length determinant protein (WzzB/FepE family)
MKIECEIDWISDQSLDSGIRDVIIESITNKLEDRFYKQLEKNTSDQLAVRIDELLNKLVNRFMNKEVVVTDNWGDVKEKHENVNELLKQKFDRWLTETVNDEGKPMSTSCSYGSKRHTRLEYFIDERIKDHQKRITKEIFATINTKLKEAQEIAIKDASEKIAETIGLNVIKQNF